MEYLKLRGIVNLKDERWRPLKGIKRLHTFKSYRVSNKGRIARLHETNNYYSWKLLLQRPDKKGLKVVNLNSAKGQVTFFVHRLVALTFNPYQHLDPIFLPERNKDLCSYDVAHIDLNKQNNEASNLEWRLPKERPGVSFKDYLTGEIFVTDTFLEASRKANVNKITLAYRLKMKPGDELYDKLLSCYVFRHADQKDIPWPEYSIEEAFRSQEKYCKC